MIVMCGTVFTLNQTAAEREPSIKGPVLIDDNRGGGLVPMGNRWSWWGSFSCVCGIAIDSHQRLPRNKFTN